VRRITVVTRREIFDYLRGGAAPWHGGLDEPAFFSRLYDLDALPSTDSRYATAAGDIAQQRIRNYDWKRTAPVKLIAGRRDRRLGAAIVA
jgi:hypothetical protein